MRVNRTKCGVFLHARKDIRYLPEKHKMYCENCQEGWAVRETFLRGRGGKKVSQIVTMGGQKLPKKTVNSHFAPYSAKYDAAV